MTSRHFKYFWVSKIWTSLVFRHLLYVTSAILIIECLPEFSLRQPSSRLDQFRLQFDLNFRQFSQSFHRGQPINIFGKNFNNIKVLLSTSKTADAQIFKELKIVSHMSAFELLSFEIINFLSKGHLSVYIFPEKSII